MKPHVEAFYDPDERELWVSRGGAYLAAFLDTGTALAHRLRDSGFEGLARQVARLRSPVLYISGMEVPREQRGAGIGGKLLSTALVLAAEHGARRAYAHMAPESRRMRDLLRFYEQHGFREESCCSEDFFPVVRHDLR